MDQPGQVADVVAAMLEQAASVHARTGRVPLARSLRRQARRLRAAFGSTGSDARRRVRAAA